MEQRKRFYLILPNIDHSTPPRFEKLDFSQLKLYNETKTTTQCFVCCNQQKNILVRSAEGLEFFLYFTNVKDT